MVLFGCIFLLNNTRSMQPSQCHIVGLDIYSEYDFNIDNVTAFYDLKYTMRYYERSLLLCVPVLCVCVPYMLFIIHIGLRNDICFSKSICYESHGRKTFHPPSNATWTHVFYTQTIKHI